MKVTLGLIGLLLAIWGVLLSASDDAIAAFALRNGLLQIGLFVVVACIPLWRTGRMSFVDIAWPFGLMVIGVQVLLEAPGRSVAVWIVGIIYLVVGFRMGFGAITMGLSTGVIFQEEFPRYRYRHEQLAQEGVTNPTWHLTAEVLVQGIANASVLAAPALLMLASPRTGLGPLEVLGFALWGVGYVIENIADGQKHLFIRKHPGALCDVGLWRYSRHPNYFGEWLVWCGLALAALPSLLALRGEVSDLVWAVLGVALLGAPSIMYYTLVYATGAKPAEHYSVQKRPGYADYQRRTSVLIPWFPKDAADDA